MDFGGGGLFGSGGFIRSFTVDVDMILSNAFSKSMKLSKALVEKVVVHHL